MDYKMVEWKFEKLAEAAAGVINSRQEFRNNKELKEYLLFLFKRVYRNVVENYKPPLIPFQDLSHIPELNKAVSNRNTLTN